MTTWGGVIGGSQRPEPERYTLEQVLNFSDEDMRRVWSMEHFSVPFRFWQYGLFQLKEETYYEGVDALPDYTGFRLSDDNPEVADAMGECWSCEYYEVDENDDLGLCDSCITQLVWPEKTTWRRHRREFSTEERLRPPRTEFPNLNMYREINWYGEPTPTQSTPDDRRQPWVVLATGQGKFAVTRTEEGEDGSD